MCPVAIISARSSRATVSTVIDSSSTPSACRSVHERSVARYIEIDSSANPTAVTNVTRCSRVWATHPTSSSNSRCAVSISDSPSLSRSPAGSSKSQRSRGVRNWRTRKTCSLSSSRGTTATAPRCRTMSRSKTSPVESDHVVAYKSKA